MIFQNTAENKSSASKDKTCTKKSVSTMIIQVANEGYNYQWSEFDSYKDYGWSRQSLLVPSSFTAFLRRLGTKLRHIGTTIPKKGNTVLPSRVWSVRLEIQRNISITIKTNKNQTDKISFCF